MPSRFQYVSPGVKLLMVFLMMLAAMVIFSLSAGIMVWAKYGSFEIDSQMLMNDTGLLKLLQLVQTLLVFMAPAVIAAYLFIPGNISGLTGRSTLRLNIILASGLTMLLSQYFIGWAGSFNSGLSLPDTWESINNWILKTESEAAELTVKLVSSDSNTGFLFNVVLISVLPAIGEEWIFRGHIQRYFGEWLKNVHLSVFITSVIFAAMHMQFMTFLPRFFLGMILGYLFYYGGNLWYSVAAHFTNNFLALITMSSKNIEEIEEAVKVQPDIPFSAGVVLSFIGTIAMIYIIGISSKYYGKSV